MEVNGPGTAPVNFETSQMESSQFESSLMMIEEESDDDSKNKLSLYAYSVEISSQAHTMQSSGGIHEGAPPQAAENQTYNSAGAMTGSMGTGGGGGSSSAGAGGSGTG